jgi:hypothetical protein
LPPNTLLLLLAPSALVNGVFRAKRSVAELLLLRPPPLQLSAEALHLLVTLSLQDLLLIKASSVWRCVVPTLRLELQALALLKLLLFAPLPHLQIV